MAAVSKLYFESAIYPNDCCKNVFHPWTNSCSKALLDCVYDVFKGASKFFLYIYLLQTISKYKNINKKFLSEQIRTYLRSLLYGAVFGGLFLSSNCLLSILFGIRYYTVGLICGAISGLSIFVESSNNRSLNTILFFSLVVETAVRYLEWSNYYKRTRTIETLCFMICNSLLMYLLKTQKRTCRITNIWFYKVQQPLNIQKCNHHHTCLHNLLKEFSKYFFIGYVIESAKNILPKLVQIPKKPNIISSALFSRNSILFGLFFGSYAGIYRLLNCFIIKKENRNRLKYALLTGFLSGISYFIKPSLQIACVAVTTVLQLLISRLTEKNWFPKNAPLTEIVFAICNGILLHNRFLLPDSCPSYVTNMLSTATNGRLDLVYHNLLQILKERVQFV